MDYRKCAEDLMYYMILGEERGRLVQNNISELAHGELAVLRFLMNEKDGASAKDLSQRFEINTSRVAAILNSLVKKGYADRQTDPEDRRMVRVYITEAGMKYAENKRNQFLDHSAAMLERLGKEDAENYIHIMKRLSEILQEMKKGEGTPP